MDPLLNTALGISRVVGPLSSRQADLEVTQHQINGMDTYTAAVID